MCIRNVDFFIAKRLQVPFGVLKHSNSNLVSEVIDFRRPACTNSGIASINDMSSLTREFEVTDRSKTVL